MPTSNDLFGSVALARACKPEVGDIYTKGEQTVKVEDVAEELIMLSIDYANGTRLTYFYRNVRKWDDDVKLTLERGAVFLPNAR